MQLWAVAASSVLAPGTPSFAAILSWYRKSNSVLNATLTSSMMPDSAWTRSQCRGCSASATRSRPHKACERQPTDASALVRPRRHVDANPQTHAHQQDPQGLCVHTYRHRHISKTHEVCGYQPTDASTLTRPTRPQDPPRPMDANPQM